MQDGWNASNYGQTQEKPAINPNSPFSSGSERVFRGGAWDFAASRCRSSGRGAYDTSLRSFLIGFRVSLAVDGVKAAIATSKPSSAVTTTAKPSAFAPFSEENIKRIAALPAAEQIEEVRKEFIKRNSGFDGTVQHKIEKGVVTSIIQDGKALNILDIISVVEW